MSNFILSSDSACDKYTYELAKNNVHCIPLAYIHNGEEIKVLPDSENVHREFYQFIRNGNLPTTTQINLMEHEEYFTELLRAHEGDLVHLTLSSGLSGTYHNAVNAARNVMEQFPDRKIYIVDSLGATQPQNCVLDRLIAMRDNGMSAEQAATEAQAFARCVNTMILPRDLLHLHRGGRVSKAAAVIGSMLKIKPLIVFDAEGRLKTVDKVNGWTKAMRALVKYAVKNIVDPQKNAIYISHADAYEDAQELKAMLKEELDVTVKIGYIGPVIGAHTGPGALGMTVVGKERQD